MTLPRSTTSSPYKIVLYQAKNLINGKRYIGITSAGLGKRVGRHFKTARLHKRGSAIGAAIRKYGQRNIKFSVLVVCPNWEYAKEMEIAAISAIKPEYNITKGGEGASGYRHSEDHKRKVSDLFKGNKFWLGKRHKPETIEKMKRSATIRVNGPNRSILLPEQNLTFPSMAAAARHLGYTTAAVSWAIKNGKRLGGTDIKSIWIGQS